MSRPSWLTCSGRFICQFESKHRAGIHQRNEKLACSFCSYVDFATYPLIRTKLSFVCARASNPFGELTALAGRIWKDVVE